MHSGQCDVYLIFKHLIYVSFLESHLCRIRYHRPFVSFGTAYPTGLGPGYIIIGKMNPFRGSFIKGGDGIDSQKADLFSGFFLRPCPNFYLADREFSLVISTPGPN